MPKAQQYIAKARRRRVIMPLYWLYRWRIVDIARLFPEVAESTIGRDIRGRVDNLGKHGRPTDREHCRGVESEPEAWAPLFKPRVGRERGAEEKEKR